MGLGHFGEALGGFFLLFICWHMFCKSGTSIMRSPESMMLWIFVLLMSGAGVVGGGNIMYSAATNAYHDYQYKKGLKAQIVQAHLAAQDRYDKAKEQFDKLTPEAKLKNTKLLNDLEIQAEKDIDPELDVVETYTADSLKKYGRTNVQYLEKEVTFSTIKHWFDPWLDKLDQK